MQVIVVFALFIVAIHAVPHGFTINMELNDEWEAYKVTFGRKYDSLNEITRRIIWEQNLKYIQKHNLEYDLGKHSYFLGLNEYADMTNEEFRSRFLGTRPRTITKLGSTFLTPENLKVLPPFVDWRKKGYVTPVKNQQQCGSCWAFSTTGSLEGQHFKKTGNLLSFSEQQLVDCSGKFGNNGCEGGLMDNAFQYIEKFGIESEEDYPYTASDGTCQYDKSKVVGNCTGYVDIPSGNEVALATAVATVGPISVAIDASHNSFQHYKGGVYNELNCSPVELDHGVLAVGYGIENNKHYWLVKNSWGASWGLAGYIKMSKDAGNQCGIATDASYPHV